MGQKKYTTRQMSEFNESYKQKIGAEIARLMKEKRMNKKYFDMMGLSFTQLNSILGASKSYTFNSLLQAIEILEMTPYQFFKNIK